ncbi:MAG: hypothetical protein M5U12_18805 [Verrucomicrobia bacterium]|nr:hypothetical protein [Verrucomicrobiota bacterium]
MNLSRRLLGMLLAACACSGTLAAWAQVTNTTSNTTGNTATNALPPLPLPLPLPLPVPAAFEAGGSDGGRAVADAHPHSA